MAKSPKKAMTDYIKKNIADNDEAARVIYREPVTISINNNKKIFKSIAPQLPVDVRISETLTFE